MDQLIDESKDYTKAAKTFYVMIPLFIAVPVVYWLVFETFGVTMNWGAFGIGAAGWIFALFLRGPLAAIVKNKSKEQAGTIVASASGPLEEGVRLLAILVVGSAFHQVASLGQGWAAVEVLFAVLNGVIQVQLLQRTDEKAKEAQRILDSTGNLNQSPLWGVSERIFASAFHIGSTLLIAANLWLVLVMIPFHTLFNLTVVKLSKGSMALTQFVISIAGAAVLFIGLILF